MEDEILFSPGPTNVPERILLAGAKKTIHHRTKPFAEILYRITENLKKVFKTKGDVFILTSSGTGAMEAAVANFINKSDSVLVLNIGAFGRRWNNILKAYGVKNVTSINYEWGNAFKIEDVKKEISNKNFHAIFCQLSETSTGTVNDIKSLGEIKPEGTLLIVDAVSGLLTEEFEMDNWNVDVAVSGSQKGFMMPPGLSFIAIRKELTEKAGENDLPKFYFSLKHARDYFQRGQTPWTPAINIVYQLDEALKMIDEEGLGNILKRHKNLAEMTRFAVKEMGLEVFSTSPANGITAVKYPEGQDATKLVELIVTKYGIRFANGQREYKGKIFRIAHMGYVNVGSMLMALNCLWLGLKELGLNPPEEAISKTLKFCSELSL